MNRTLRFRHRWMTTLMGVSALAGLTVALNQRPPAAVMPRLPDVLLNAGGAPPPAPAHGSLRRGEELWEGAQLRTELYAEVVELTVVAPLYRPTPLLYWAPAAPALGDPLPDGAVLLGPLSNDPRPQRFRLPDSTGALTLFSLAHGEVFASLALAQESSR